MNGFAGIVSTALTLLTALIALVILSGRQTARTSAEQERHASWISAEKLARARTRSDRELSALEESRRHSERRRVELVQAAGGELAYALCDPGVSLRRSLALIAESCLPPGTAVEVRVERFIEFEVVARLSVRATSEAMAKAARCILIEAAGPIHTLTFVANGAVAARLDRQTIESVPDWTAIPDSQLQALLSEGEGAPAPGRTAQPPPTTVETESVSPEMERLRAVEAAFAATYQQRIATMNSKATDLLKLSDLVTVSGPADLRSRTLQARVLAAEIQELRIGLLDPFPEMTQELLNAGADPVLVRVMIRSNRERTQSARTALSQVLSSLVQVEPPLEQYLAMAERTWGRWETDQSGTTFTFHDAESRDIFGNYRSALNLAVSAHNAAIENWNRVNTRP